MTKMECILLGLEVVTALWLQSNKNYIILSVLVDMG